MNNSNKPPVMLTLSALDPSGCGGIQADIEVAASLGCHCAPVATALCTATAAQTVEALPVSSTLIIEQARSVLEDMYVAVIKLGFVGSVANAETIHSIIKDYPDLPCVMHPAFCLWDENDSEQADLPGAINALLLPLTDVTVLSLDEAKILTNEGDTLDATAQSLLSTGCKHLLLSATTSGNERQLQNNLYSPEGLVQQYHWEQNAPICHGSSSTLASAIAAFLAHGCPVQSAIEQGQNYTWQTLAAARQLGFGKPTPHRLFWADKNIEQPGCMPVRVSTH